MQSLTITFERVFDLRRRHTKQGKFSEFSFQAGGEIHYGISVPGWPAIAPGTTVTAVLHQEGNWRTLAGWVNNVSGEMASQSYAAEFIFSPIAFLTLVFFGLLLFGRGAVTTSPLQYGSGVICCTFLAAMSIGLFVQGLKNFRASRALHALAKSPLSVTGRNP